MKNLITTLILGVTLLGTACSSTTPGLFSKRTPHEKYADRLDKQDLDKTPQGRQWLAAAQAAVAMPHTVQLPYRQVGQFQTDKPRALGLAFTAKQGERLLFTLSKEAAANFVVYADLFKQNGTAVEHLLASDTNATQFTLDVAEAGTYVLRLQPELERTGEYSLSIAIGPSIGYPVSGTKARAGSFWGASRDGGKRNHEGVDIFAPKGTPAIASEDGIVTGVKEGGIGGKVVWMRSAEKAHYLYYAHLDQQLVQTGQLVKKGDTLGTIGNTGNARTTPPHLHFGVYTSSGPVDPYPFINKTVKTAPAVPEKSLAHYLRLTKTQKVNNQSIAANVVLVPLAVTTKGYISESPEGQVFLTPFTAVKSTGQPVRGASKITASSEGGKEVRSNNKG